MFYNIMRFIYSKTINKYKPVWTRSGRLKFAGPFKNVATWTKYGTPGIAPLKMYSVPETKFASTGVLSIEFS